jgi:HD-GYP domain-containing protein (c-di-GMP phosphodiesterase class II)
MNGVQMSTETGDTGSSLDTERLRTLINLVRAMTRAGNLRSLIRLLIQETSRIMEAERSSVFLHDRKTDELWSFVAEGENKEIRFSADRGIAGHVFRTGELLLIEDTSNDERFNPEVDLMTGFHTRNLLTAPIRNPSGRILGVFQVVNRTHNSLSRDDEAFFDAIINEAAVTIDNVTLSEDRKKMFDSLIGALVESIESRDPITAGHSFKVMEYSSEIAERLNLDNKTKEAIHYASLLHDYGKIGVPDEILKKEGRLTPEEHCIIQTHIDHTRRILDGIEFKEDLEIVPTFASQHHERLSGTGYPDGLQGNDISIGGRVIAVADVFEALTSLRHYRDPMSDSMAIGILTSAMGSEFARDAVLALRQYLIDTGRITEGQAPLADD